MSKKRRPLTFTRQSTPSTTPTRQERNNDFSHLTQHDLTAYPLTVVLTRYGGIYEGGRWACFALDPEQLPWEAFGGDVDCMIWWRENGADIGTGHTPNDAVADYHERVLGLVQCPIAAQAGIQRYVEAR